MGKLLDYDRIAEVRCLREKMQELFENKATTALNSLLASDWVNVKESAYIMATLKMICYNSSIQHIDGAL